VVAAATAASDHAASSPLVLASASPTRRALLQAAGLHFTTFPAGIDEADVKRAALAQQATAADTALLLARRKAEAVDQPGAVVIGCDQILVCNDLWYDKPPDLPAARRQLRSLRGQAHTLQTACVARRDDTELFSHVAAPRLFMRAFSDRFLDSYLAEEGEAILGSVGAYRLEGPGIQLFDRIEGDHTAILGLPMLPLLGFLRALGMIAD